MKTLNIMLSNLSGRVIPIGYEGENLYTRIRINCIEVFSEYPDATVSMVVSPPVGDMYPAVVEKSGVMVVWDITDSVLSSNGSGECQLTFTEGDVVRKSVVFGISINRSLIASGEAPEPVREWIDKAEQTAQEIAENAANLAKEDIVESYGSIAPAIIETASGAIASFSDGADGMLVKTLSISIEPVQEGSGDPSPENVRPISGWDSAEVIRSGENLCNPDDFVQGTLSGATGEINSSSSRIASDFVPVEENSKYFLIVDDDKYVFEIAGYGNNRTFINLFTSVNATSGVITTPANCKWIRFTVRKPDNSAINPSAIQKAGVIKSAVSVPYIPYQGSEIEYEFPQEAKPVYGGTLTIHQDGSGELVVDRVSVDLGEMNWYYQSTYGYYTTSLDDVIKSPSANTVPANINCSARKTDTWNNLVANGKTGNTIAVSNGYLGISEPTIVNSQEFTTAITGTQLVYELATPVTYQLTNQQVIALLKGSNNILADTGNVSLEYPADTKLYIDGKVAELQALILENISNS